MVYLGPSKGCYSCRLRRKKCDETRPSCMRCIKANRTCSGYDNRRLMMFRQYEAPDVIQSPPFISTARKCSMPKRVPISGTQILPKDVVPLETSQQESNELSLRSFFYDYCVISTNKNLSRGFLSTLETTAYSLGLKSDLVKACQAVAFASHGKPLNRPYLVNKAERFYQELLGSLARAIQSPSSANATESKLVAMLLGFYQITVATELDHGYHDTHSKGMAALMKIEHSPLYLLGATTSNGCRLKKYLQGSSILSIPALSGNGESLNDLLLNFYSVWTKYEAIVDLKEDRSALKADAIALDQRFANWENSRLVEFQPSVAGHVHNSLGKSEFMPGYWPGKVDSYFDLCVAGVWNIFRVARLLLTALIINLTDTFGDTDSYQIFIDTANRMASDMLASVPYHLTDNLQVFLRELAINTEITERGKSLGGLLLMHPLYVASKMSFLSESMREYMRACLIWIGTNMGLGQATVLATASDIDKDYLASGCMIIWSGFLW